MPLEGAFGNNGSGLLKFGIFISADVKMPHKKSASTGANGTTHLIIFKELLSVF